MSLHVIILAAGNGKRMHSHLPKVMHLLAGKPMLRHVLETAAQLQPEKIHIVYGHQGEMVRQAFPEALYHWVHQERQLGTAHAVQQALPFVPEDAMVLVLYGDAPLISVETLRVLIQQSESNALCLLTAILMEPFGYGRVLRNDAGQVTRIVEERDADSIQKKITEIYSGILLAEANFLKRAMPKVTNQNEQQEFYLTDVIALAVSENRMIKSAQPIATEEIFGVNDRWQMSMAERYFQQRQAKIFAQRGLCLIDPYRFDLRGHFTFGADVVIEPDVILEGNISVGDSSYVGSYCVLKNVTVGKNVQIKSHCVLEDCEIEDHAVIGPFARIRPGTILQAETHIGNFVEVKKSVVGRGSKINHLSYIGDAIIGESVNVGAGTITCNYDGVHKHTTVIEDGAFIGSDTQLIPPITVGKNANIAAGSTVRRDVPPEKLTVTHHLEQRVIERWRRPTKDETDPT